MIVRIRQSVMSLLLAVSVVCTGMAVRATGSNDALVFRSADKSVGLAVVCDGNVNVQQVSPPGQQVEYIAVAPNGICAWVLDRQDKSGTTEGWTKYGPLRTYVVRPSTLSIAPYQLCQTALSQDGKNLLYVAECKDGRRLCSKNLNTGSTEILTTAWEFIQQPTWSPDGTKACYFCTNGPYGFRLHVIDMATRTDIEVAPPSLAMRYNGDAMGEIVWSPDSKYMFFTARYEEGRFPVNEGDTYRVLASGGEPPVRVAKKTLKSLSPDGMVINAGGKGYRIGPAGFTPAVLPEAMMDSRRPSISGKAAAFRKLHWPPDVPDIDGLWCKVLPGGKEVMVTPRWGDTWDDMLRCKWTTLPASR